MPEEFIILESKINYLNFEEMELMFKDYYENNVPKKSTKERKLDKLPKYITRQKTGAYLVIRNFENKRYYIGIFYSLKKAKIALNKFNVYHGFL